MIELNLGRNMFSIDYGRDAEDSTITCQLLVDMCTHLLTLAGKSILFIIFNNLHKARFQLVSIIEVVLN